MTVEMLFHAKALEVFTLAYQSIQNVDEDEDLEVRPALLIGPVAHRPHPPTRPDPSGRSGSTPAEPSFSFLRS